MIQSMSRKGNCWDNAPMESCFGTLKTELVHQACYQSWHAARQDLFAYIEGYYNRQRLHSALGYQPGLFHLVGFEGRIAIGEDYGGSPSLHVFHCVQSSGIQAIDVE